MVKKVSVKSIGVGSWLGTVRNVAPNRMKRHDGFPEKDKRDALLIATVILFQLLKLMKC